MLKGNMSMVSAIDTEGGAGVPYSITNILVSWCHVCCKVTTV